jgi:hypothetical protein
VNFKLEQQCPGILASVTGPEDNRDSNAASVWTEVDSYGVARCDLLSEAPGEVDVDCLLYDNSTNMLINKHGFVVFYLKLESITLTNVLGERVDNPFTNAIEGHNSGIFLPDDVSSQDYGPWNATLDSTTDELNVSADTLLRAVVKGWFMGDDLSIREALPIDTDGDGEMDMMLPAGRWVLPDDWRKLGGGNLWEELRPHWDIMDQPNDNIMSDPDGGIAWMLVQVEPGVWEWQWVVYEDANKVQELGDYSEWLEVGGVSSIIDLVAEYPVIGPYSSLDDYTPYINNPDILDRKTIVRNGELNWWDCPMPPRRSCLRLPVETILATSNRWTRAMSTTM